MSKANMDDIVMHLRSQDASVVRTNGDHVFELIAPIIAPAEHMIHVSLYSAEVMNSFFNVNLTNSLLKVSETAAGSTTSRTIAVVQGNYTGDTLQTTIEETLNANGNPIQYTVAFSPVTGRFTFSTQTANATAVLQFTDLENSIRKCLGFSNSDFTMTTSVPLSSNQVADLSGQNHALLIRSSDLSGRNVIDSQGRMDSTLFKLPITANNFEMITYRQTGEDIRVHLGRTRIQRFSLRITNQDEQLLDFNDITWSLSLRFEMVPVRDMTQAHPIQQVVDRARNEIFDMSVDLQAEIDRVSTNMARIHEALPLLRRGVIERRQVYLDQIVASNEIRTTLTEDNIDA